MHNNWFFFVATLKYTDFISLLMAQKHRNTKDDSRGSSYKSSRFFPNVVCMWELFTNELDLLVAIFVLDFFQNKVKITKRVCPYWKLQLFYIYFRAWNTHAHYAWSHPNQVWYDTFLVIFYRDMKQHEAFSSWSEQRFPNWGQFNSLK